MLPIQNRRDSRDCEERTIHYLLFSVTKRSSSEHEQLSPFRKNYIFVKNLGVKLTSNTLCKRERFKQQKLPFKFFLPHFLFMRKKTNGR